MNTRFTRKEHVVAARCFIVRHSESVSYRRNVAERIQPCCFRGNGRHLPPGWAKNPQTSPAAGMDAGLPGRSYRPWTGIHFRCRARQEGAVLAFIGNSGSRVRHVPISAFAWCLGQAGSNPSQQTARNQNPSGCPRNWSVPLWAGQGKADANSQLGDRRQGGPGSLA